MLRLSLVFFVWLASTATPVTGLTETNVRTIISGDACATAHQGRTHARHDPG